MLDDGEHSYSDMPRVHFRVFPFTRGMLGGAVFPDSRETMTFQLFLDTIRTKLFVLWESIKAWLAQGSLYRLSAWHSCFFSPSLLPSLFFCIFCWAWCS